MNKRKLPYGEDTEDCADDEHPAPDLGKISTPEEIAQRRILKIKGSKSEETTTPAKLVLVEKLDETKPEVKLDSQGPSLSEEQPKSLLFNNTSTLFNNKKEGEQQTDKQDPQAKQTVENTGATNSNATNPSSIGAKTENGSAQHSIFTKPTGGLFSSFSQTSTSSLFGGNNTNLFGASSLGTGLFSNIKKDTTPSSIPNIFSNTTPIGGLFSTNGGSLGNNSKEPVSIFGQLPFSNNSGQQSTLGAVAGSDDEGEGGEEDDEIEHSPEIDPSAQTVYEYNNPFEKVVDKQIVKLRKGTNDILEKGSISLEKHKENTTTPNIFVYRDQIKKVIFTYNVIKKVSKVEKINNASKNLKFSFYRKEEDKFVQDIIKVQFAEEKDGEEFLEKISASIKD